MPKRQTNTQIKPELLNDGLPVQPESVFTRIKTKRTFEEISARLREMMAEGALKPGDKLPPERELCERFGVGRATLREALRSLESAGVIDLKMGKFGGAFVTSGNTRVISSGMRDLLHLQNISFENLTEARLSVSRVVVALAIERATADDIAALDENIAVADRLFIQGRLMDKTKKNIEFHSVLAKATKNPIMVILTETLTDLFGYFVDRLGSEMSRETFASRERFMTAFKARDTTAAMAEMDANLRKVHKLYSSLAQSNVKSDLPVAMKPARKKRVVGE